MKKILSLLSALAIICTIPMINIIDVNALEAATMEEYNTQIKEKDEFPNPDEKYTEITENNLVYHLYNEYAVLYECKDREITEIEIPAEIKGLPVTGAVDSPFGFCRNLKKITLPDTFENFEFHDLTCTTVTKLSSQNTDILIPSVSEVIVSETNPYYTLKDGMIYTKDMKTLIGCPPAMNIKELKISEQTETISDYAFFSCFNLEKAVIPANVKHINNGAFTACINLKNIEFPESITSVSGGICYSCVSLSNVVFKGEIEKIGYNAFENCYSLDSFDIPETVSYIGNCAFEMAGCTENINGIHYVNNWVVGSDEEIENADIKEGTTGIAELSFFTRSYINYINVPSSVKHINYVVFGQINSEKISRLDYRCSFIEEKTIAAAKNTKDFYIYDPKCDIYDSDKTIPAEYKYQQSVNTDTDNVFGITHKEYITDNTIIHGFEGSTAQAYAEKYNRKFKVIRESSSIKGDINADGSFNAADIILLNRWILDADDTELSDWKAVDLHEDGKLDVLDICKMKHELIK